MTMSNIICQIKHTNDWADWITYKKNFKSIQFWMVRRNQKSKNSSILYNV